MWQVGEILRWEPHQCHLVLGPLSKMWKSWAVGFVLLKVCGVHM